MKRLLLLCCLLSACVTENDTEELHSIDSRMLLGQPTPAMLSDIAESVEVVRLETRDDALVGVEPTVTMVDSLAVVFSFQNGVFVFDSRTGRFRHKIIGFGDRGPLGYNGANINPMTLKASGRMFLRAWDKIGVWNFRTGEMLGHTLPLNPYLYQKMLFVNDTLLLGSKFQIRDLDNAVSALDAIRYGDGSVVREYGFFEETDKNPGLVFGGAVVMSEYGGYINYVHFVHDYIYGIDRETLAIEPRYVLNLGSRLKENVTPVTVEDFSEEYTSVTAMCETDRWLFLRFYDSPDDVQHCVVYDKVSRETHFIDSYNWERDGRRYGFVDDLGVGIPFFPDGVTSDGRAYRIVQAVDVVAAVGESRAAELGVSETDNPVLVVVALKE
ncbi:MAG: 6-bladed beta-propeller [Alistipes sp.]|jgi:hypothetical protein|nr:6-bladed beta-propeller [Alistipes sp.]